VSEALEVASALLCMAVVLFAPVGFLLGGWWHMRARRYDRAGSFATIAGVCSWFLLAIEGLLVPYALLQGVPLWVDPGSMLLFSYPPAVWFYARTLTASIARHRTEDRIEVRMRREEERERKDGEAGA